MACPKHIQKISHIGPFFDDWRFTYRYKKHQRDNIRRRLKSRKASCSCRCTAEDCECEVLYIVVIETLAYVFVNANLLRCARLLKSAKVKQRTAEMFVTVILMINYVEILKTEANGPSTFCLVALDSYLTSIGICF